MERSHAWPGRLRKPLTPASERALFDHAPYRRVDVQALDIFACEPCDLRRFVAAHKPCAGRRKEKESDVVVKMRRLRVVCRNLVDIHIENRLRGKSDTAKPGLLGDLALRNTDEIDIAVGMPARLQPPSKLTVANQDGMKARFVDHPR